MPAMRVLGLLVDVPRVTGARASQVARLEVGDLRAQDLAEAKLPMPRTAKAAAAFASSAFAHQPSHDAGLPVRLKAAAAGRPLDAPLLLWRDGRGWGVERSANFRADFRAIVAEVGLGADVTPNALRHSSITRQLLAGVPDQARESLHERASVEIEQHYARYISEGSDAISRRALLADELPIGGNIIPLSR